MIDTTETMGEINRQAGGATKVFKASTIADWLHKENPIDTDFRVENFYYLTIANIKII